MSLLEKYYTDEHQIFRQSVRRFYEDEIVPNVEEWEEKGILPREVWKKFGAQGFLCPWLPEEYGGSGVDFLYSVIIMEEAAVVRSACAPFPVHSDIIVPYLYHFTNDEQKKRWLPGCASGASQIVDIEMAARFCLEVAKALGQGKSVFYDAEEFGRLVALYGSMRHLQTGGARDERATSSS